MCIRDSLNSDCPAAAGQSELRKTASLGRGHWAPPPASRLWACLWPRKLPVPARSSACHLAPDAPRYWGRTWLIVYGTAPFRFLTIIFLFERVSRSVFWALVKDLPLMPSNKGRCRRRRSATNPVREPLELHVLLRAANGQQKRYWRSMQSRKGDEVPSLRLWDADEPLV